MRLTSAFCLFLSLGIQFILKGVSVLQVYFFILRYTIYINIFYSQWRQNTFSSREILHQTRNERKIFTYSLITLCPLIHIFKITAAACMLLVSCLKNKCRIIFYVALVLLFQYFLEPLRSPVCCTLQSDCTKQGGIFTEHGAMSMQL